MGAVRIDTASVFAAAPPSRVFAAFADGDTLMAWLPPNDMRGRALVYDFRVGGAYRFELRYGRTAPAGVGKTESKSDVSGGRFVAIEPDRRIVWTVDFDATDPSFAGTMTMTWTFAPEADGTRVVVRAEDVPAGISPEDHQMGLDATLANLAEWAQAPR